MLRAGHGEVTALQSRDERRRADDFEGETRHEASAGTLEDNFSAHFTIYSS